MSQPFSHRVTGKPRRTTRLVVEALEGRDVPSTLPMLAPPTPSVAWPSQAVVLGGALQTGGAGTSFIAGGADHGVSIALCSTGEEIPQT